MHDILVIGYGNTLRGDDALGVYAAHLLQRDFEDDPQVRVIATQQLAPELADYMADARFALFIDASAAGEPGAIRRVVVEPEQGSRSCTHSVTSASLLAAARQLYGAAVQATCLTLTGWTFDLSDRLSPGAEVRLPELIRQAREIISQHKQLSTAKHSDS